MPKSILEKIIDTAKRIGPKLIWADECLSKWIWDLKQIDIKYFLANDDIRTMYHIIRWKEDSPRPLKELCENIINRKLDKYDNYMELLRPSVHDTGDIYTQESALNFIATFTKRRNVMEILMNLRVLSQTDTGSTT